MSLKDFIDTNPLIVLIGVGVVVASTTYGVATHLASNKAEVAAGKAEVDKTCAETEFRSEIATLKTRLVSIERRIGSDERSFFDISRLFLAHDRVKELDSSYRTMADGAFFIAEPSMKEWRYVLTSEFEMLREGMPDMAKALGGLESVMGKKNVHMWRGPKPVEVTPAPAASGEQILKKMTFVPYVVVQKVVEEDLRGIGRALDDVVWDHSDKRELLEALEVAIEVSKSDGGPKAGDPKLVEARANAAAKTEQELRQMFRGDLAAYFLGALIQGNMELATHVGAQFQLRTTQKKGNVLYVETRLEFPEVVVDGQGSPRRLIVDQELFLMTSPSGIVAVKVQIPSFDGRGDAYSWIGQWLSGLRITIRG